MDASHVLARPEPGETTTGSTAPVPEPGWLDRLADVPPALWVAAGIALTLAAVTVTIARLIRRRPTTRTTFSGDKLMTFFGAVVATGVVATGMWEFFGHVLHIDDPLIRVALFAFFEIAMLAEALRSRRFRLGRAQRADQRANERAQRIRDGQPTADLDQADADDRRGLDVDGIAVWVLALCSGSFAAMDQDTAAGAALRLVAPIVAAWLWERGLAGELQQFRRPARRGRINWTVSLERLMVWLRLAEATGREVNEVDRLRRRDVFTVAAFRLHTLRAEGAWGWRVSLAKWRLRRAGLDIMGRFGVAELRAAQLDVATLYGIEDGTSPDAVRHLAPWQVSVVGALPERGAITATAATATATNPGGATQPAATQTATATEQPPPPPVEEVALPEPTATATPAESATATATPSQESAATGTATNSGSATAIGTPTPEPKTTRGATATATGGGKSKTPTVSQALIDAIRDGWTEAFRIKSDTWDEDQAKRYAVNAGRLVLSDAGSKTDGMHRYWLVMKALGHEPKGTPMAEAVEASPSLGRRLAAEWKAQLDAERLVNAVEEAFTATATATNDTATSETATVTSGATR